MPVALITGGGTGIGAATARRLAADGWSVVVTGRRLEPIAQIAAEVDGLAIQADQSIEDDCRRAVEQAVERFGGIDTLIANAGTGASATAEMVDLDRWDHVIDVNLRGVLLVVRAALPALREVGGSIVIVSSVAGLAAGPQSAAYVTSKTALLGLTRSLALDLGADGVRVNALCPGWVATEMSDREVADLAASLRVDHNEARRRLVEYLPLGRMAEASELAGCVAFLAGSDSSFMTGTSLVVDGGGSAVDVGTLAFAALKPS